MISERTVSEALRGPTCELAENVDRTRTERTQGKGSEATSPARPSASLADFKGTFGEPGGTRTRDPLLKRQMLYRLSYRPGSEIFSLAYRAEPTARPAGCCCVM